MKPARGNLLKELDYSVLQQCMHCGMCLPTCPTYDITKQERNSPRGRISLMRAIADDRLEVSQTFGEEMYYCLGCLACKTACPAGVDYPRLFESARAEVERSGVLDHPWRRFVRWSSLHLIFGHKTLLHFLGRLLYFHQASGLQKLLRRSGLLALLPAKIRQMEEMTPSMQKYFSHELIEEEEAPARFSYSVGLLTGCVQDMMYADINRDTADVLLAAGCRVITPHSQLCCGSLHAHNGDLDGAREFARRLMDQFDLEGIDAIISNAGGCGSHLKDYAHLLHDDPAYSVKAKVWSGKLKDIHEWLVEIGFDKILKNSGATCGEKITYHDSCHLAHGQAVVNQPRRLLASIPGLHLVDLPEANWCCGSAGVYNLTQPETAGQLAERKLDNILKTDCRIVATANPGCLMQIQKVAERKGLTLKVVHPVSIMAATIRPSTSH